MKYYVQLLKKKINFIRKKKKKNSNALNVKKDSVKNVQNVKNVESAKNHELKKTDKLKKMAQSIYERGEIELSKIIKMVNKTKTAKVIEVPEIMKVSKPKQSQHDVKLIQLANKKKIINNTVLNMTIKDIKLNEIRKFYFNNSNSFINSDGLQCNILSAVNCNENNILFYILVFSFTNISSNFLELIKIHISDYKTKETITKTSQFILVNNEHYISNNLQNKRIFSNVKIAIKIQENEIFSQYTKQNTCIQDLSLDNIFYIIEYRKWNNYNECFNNASVNALSVPYDKNRKN
ncbi:conserved protein, unknown function [Hepatocystis sp. ex Piliocolobus tephrosceles]|nr:conserved protein, unknown function [Hepatocystis sp. ex Piliocolobus tephrosceles]